MLDAAYMESVKERYASHRALRRELMGLAATAQNEAKRAIFALHRDDAASAGALLASSETKLRDIRSRVDKVPELASEGMYRAALEEYTEAALYRDYLQDGSIGPVSSDAVTHDLYIGGIADLTGELQRRQVRLATEGKIDEVRKLKDEIAAVVDVLLQMDLEGYLRTKFDQAKNNLRRAEDVLYEITLRRT